MSTSYEISDGPKMLRETLCVAQVSINEFYKNRSITDGRWKEHIQRLERLIEECDTHRPLGVGGKHGDLHTPTCGCDRS